jgi:SAM-dependent methyltransferase
MRAFQFVVVSHPRLAFREAEGKVLDFLRRRIAQAGAPEPLFVADRDEGVRTAARLLAQASDGYVVLHDAMNPLVDLQLVREMGAALDRNTAAVALCDGAVPGTQVEAVFSASRLDAVPAKWGAGDDTLRVRWFSQDRHNNQFNLYKYKRLKMFLGLEAELQGMHAMSVDEFVAALERDDVFGKLAAFFEDAELIVHTSCPHCDGRLVSLPMRMSQPFCGYLPSRRPLYHECERCSLIVASPALHEKDVAAVYDEWDRQDFVVTHNNPYHAGAPRGDFSQIADDLPHRTRSLDLGGGMGRFSLYLKQAFPEWSVTHSDFEIKRNQNLEDVGIRTRALNFLKEPIGSGSYDLITAWEVLEHVPFHRLSGVLDSIHRALAPGGFFVFSTPNFDSPVCRGMDFFAVCPPFHFLVFGERWLRRYFAQSAKWQYLPPRACSDFLDDALMWYDYGARTSPSLQLRATAEFLRAIFEQDPQSDLRRALLKKGFGTEVIVTLRRS